MLKALMVCVCGILCGAVFAANAANNIIFKLNFKDNSPVAAIARGDKSPLKIKGIKYLKSRLGTAVEIKNSAVLVYKTPGNINPGAGTLMMWIKPDKNSETMFTMGARWFKNNFFTFRVSEKFKNAYVIFKKNGSNLASINYRAVPELGYWGHYAITWGNGKLKLFRNGQLAQQTEMTEVWDASDLPATMWIGSSGDGRFQANSAFADIRIYDRPLTSKEIIADVEALRKGTVSGKVNAPAKRKFSWRDWNKKATPIEGRRISELYECNKYIISDKRYHRFEFNLKDKVSDAYLIYSSMNGTGQRHIVKVNGKVALDVIGKAVRASGKPVIAAVKNLRSGKNVITVDGRWLGLELLVNLKDGTQYSFCAGPDWYSTDRKFAGWDSIGYKGKTQELQYRLGHEGYHQHQNRFNNRPYAGLITLKRDKANYPVYRRGESMKWSVAIPENFYGLKKPELTCSLVDEFNNGKALTFSGRFVKKVDGRLIYRVEKQLHEVGAFTVTLSFGNKKALTRREEVVVFGKIPQPEVTASEIFSELKKTLICSIDCTKPNDPDNPVVLSGAVGSSPAGKIVQRGKLKYFQTGPEAAFLAKEHLNNYAMWKFRADKLNQFYLAEVDIPDDKDRVQIIALVHGIAGYECGTESTVETGYPRPLTNKVVTHRVLFIPKFHDGRIMISPVHSSRKRNGAAVKAIRIYRIEGLLPQVKLGNSGRKNSTYNERANLPAISYYPGSDAFQMFHGKNLDAPGQYRRWYLALFNHIQILRMSAQNAVCHGLYMYVKEEYPVSKEATDFVRLMQDMYGANYIDFYGNSQYFTSQELEGRSLGHRVLGTKLSNEDVANGADSCRLVSKDGKQAPDYPMNNPCHPSIQNDLTRVFKNIAQRYAAHDNFHGMMIFAGTMGCAMSFRDMNWGYGDYTYNLFRKKNRSDAPDFKGAKRFKKRYEWIRKNAKSDFIKFRCHELYDLNKRLLDILKKKKADCKLLVNMCAWPWRKNIGNGSVAELKSRLLGTGADPAMYYSNPSMLVLHNDWMGAHIWGNKELKLVEEYNRNSEIWEYVTGGRPCGAFFWTGYYETRLYLPPEMLNQCWFANNWFFNYEKRFIGSAGKLGRNYLSAYTNAMAYADPVIFINRFTDVAEHRGFVDMKAEAGEAVSYIPVGAYKAVDGSSSDVILKRCGKNAYLVNNTCKAQKITIQSVDLSNPVSGKKFTSVNGVTSLTLKPYQIVPLMLPDGKSAISIKKNN